MVSRVLVEELLGMFLMCNSLWVMVKFFLLLME